LRIIIAFLLVFTFATPASAFSPSGFGWFTPSPAPIVFTEEEEVEPEEPEEVEPEEVVEEVEEPTEEPQPEEEPIAESQQAEEPAPIEEPAPVDEPIDEPAPIDEQIPGTREYLISMGFSPSGFAPAEVEPVAEITVDPIIEQTEEPPIEIIVEEEEPLIIAEVLPEPPKVEPVKVEPVKAANEVSDAFFAHKIALPATGGNGLIAIIALSLITAGVAVMVMVAKEVIK